MGRNIRRDGISVSSSGGVEMKTVSITIPTDSLSASIAHGLGFTPKTSRPNPDNVAGASAYASSDGTNTTVTLSDRQGVDITFQVHLSAV